MRSSPSPLSALPIFVWQKNRLLLLSVFFEGHAFLTDAVACDDEEINKITRIDIALAGTC